MEAATTAIESFISQLPDDRKNVVKSLRKTFTDNLPKGFAELVSATAIQYCVPHSLYPKGYHCNPKQPLPLIYIMNHKNFIAVYHMGIYADKNLLNWFVTEYPKHCTAKLDMGKSCIRFKKMDQVPYKLLAELSKKLTVNQWINLYETSFIKQ